MQQVVSMNTINQSIDAYNLDKTAMDKMDNENDFQGIIQGLLSEDVGTKIETIKEGLGKEKETHKDTNYIQITKEEN